MEDPRSARDLLYDLKAAHARAIDLQAARQDPPTSEYYTHIEVSEIETAGGSGVTLDGEGVKNMIQFPANWLRNRGLTASECRVISVKDESMEPTLAAGCSILIHLTRRRRTDRIYVIRTGDERIVKRAVRSNEAGWMLVSDNPDKDRFPTRPWADDAKVIGEVKWYGQSFKWKDGEDVGTQDDGCGSGPKRVGGLPLRGRRRCLRLCCAAGPMRLDRRGARPARKRSIKTSRLKPWIARRSSTSRLSCDRLRTSTTSRATRLNTRRSTKRGSRTEPARRWI